MKHFKFFVNRQCEYYPCHSMMDEENFNCMFCYCPLYALNSCPGNPKYFVNQRGQRVKDCSQCTFPHKRANYERIMEELSRHDRVIVWDVSILKDKVMERMEEICHWDVVDAETAAEQKQDASDVFDRYFCDKEISILLQSFDRSCVKKGYFLFGKNRIVCQALEQIDGECVAGGHIYVFHAPDAEVSEEASLMHQYYVEGIQIAILDVARERIRDFIQSTEDRYSGKYITDSFGPGFYGMPIEAVSDLMKMLSPEKVGVSLEENGNMSPVKSCIGLFLTGSVAFSMKSRDCINCMGNSSGCGLCKKPTQS